MSPSRLRRSDCNGPGLRRRRAGKGFTYFGPDGRRITESEVLERIAGLAIPPAWDQVWICPHPNGHIQAIGVDSRGRRQYRYHDAWRIQRDRAKFDHMLEFAVCLPELRNHCESALGDEGLGRERVLAAAVRLLDVGFFRIGTEGYAEENQTYGLASIEKRHVRVRRQEVRFDYIAKSGKRRLQTVVDPAVADVVAALKARRSGGPRLLAARQGRRWVPVSSHDINAHIREITGGEFTAKDFRTWNATVLAGVALAVSTNAISATARRRAVARAMTEVAGYLGNTPAVCRKSYVDPRVVDRFLEGITIQGALDRLGDGVGFGSLSTQGAVEAAILDLLGGEGIEAAVLAA